MHKTVAISKLTENPDNPRFIIESKFERLVKSLEDFPDMIKARPIVVDKDYKVLGGNMRLKACIALGWTKVPVFIAKEWSAEQEKEFAIKDNVSFGQWDWEMLANEWDHEQLSTWNLALPDLAPDLNYELLAKDDGDDQIAAMAGGVKRAILLEFEADDYGTAYDLIQHFRKEGYYVGGMVIEFLRGEQAKEN